MAQTLGVRFSYTEDGAFALDGVSISVERGEFVAVIGRNGSGKSTMARHLNALLRPTAGTVLIEGRDTADDAETWEIRRAAGMVFQNPDNQLVATIVEDDAAFGPENLGVPPEEIRARVDKALADVGMTEHAKSAPHRLSGGQKQRVAIAGVLAMKPDCVILDEPTAMLDPVGREDVMATAERLNRDDGITIILITHDMDEAARAGRVIVMDSGRVVMDAPPREVFSRADELARYGLGVPQAAECAQALRALGFEADPGILGGAELAEAVSKLRGSGSLDADRDNQSDI
jgi:energy-coupling factor transport system ATP-binding protein